MSILRLAVILTIVALPVFVVKTPSASADPGFCGVRMQGPTPLRNSIPVGVDRYYAYTIQNKCDSPANLTIKFRNAPSPTCRTVEPHAEETYTALAGEKDWTIASC